MVERVWWEHGCERDLSFWVRRMVARGNCAGQPVVEYRHLTSAELFQVLEDESFAVLTGRALPQPID